MIVTGKIFSLRSISVKKERIFGLTAAEFLFLIRHI